MTRYISTRGHGTSKESGPKNFEEVLLAGLAPDGGLFVPESWPVFDTKTLNRMAGASYAEIAAQVMLPFIGTSIDHGAFNKILKEVYAGHVFDHASVAPLAQLSPQIWNMELHRGPTLAFKDVALQLLGRLFDHVLTKNKQRVTIVGATSGDTGSAAIEGCKSCNNVDIFILHPLNRVSEVQRRQMTTVMADNVHNIAIEGTFDDCQSLVKAMFNDAKFRADMNLSAINSINWARIMAQVVYYFTSAIALGAPEREISYSVPTGNFGNVYAAHVARKMGLPIKRLVVSTNRNDILTRFFETGEMKITHVEASLSPSMDIQISSNFERYLFELLGRDTLKLTEIMNEFKKNGQFRLNDELMAQARREFTAHRCTDEDTLRIIRQCHEETAEVIDPHTAVALSGALALKDDPSIPIVSLACAHAAKFPDAVEKAIGRRPELPERLSDLLSRPERFTPMKNSLKTVQEYVRTHTRVKA
ncbi:MAG: threonine synthase [Alphaproteobacteria bacterium]|nr:threonine synthase [Alphaproteobacteria bacterium]